MGVISGDELGPQLHLGERPQPPLDWAARVIDGTHGKLARGGLWTSTIRTDGGTSCSDYCTVVDPVQYAGLPAWTLTPDPEARIVQLDTPDDFDWIARTFGASPWLPVRAIRDAGYAGVNVTDRAIRESAARGKRLHWWHSESTCWFGWRFDGNAAQFDDRNATRPLAISPAGGAALNVDYLSHWMLTIDQDTARRWWPPMGFFQSAMSGGGRGYVLNQEHLPDILNAMVLRWDHASRFCDAYSIRVRIPRDEQVAIYEAIQRAIAPPSVRFVMQAGVPVATSY